MVAMPTRTIFRSACPLDKRADAIPLAMTAKLMRKSRRFTDSHYPRESDYPLKPSTIFRASVPSRRCSEMGRTMSESGQHGPDGLETRLLLYPDQRTSLDRSGWSGSCQFPP